MSSFNLTYVAFIFFGLSAYALVLGIWVEVAAFYRSAPEGSRFSAYFVVVLQLSNVAPFIYMLVGAKCPKSHLKGLIYTILATGAFASVLLALFYDVQVKIAGTQCSAPLFALVFLAGMASTSTNVSYFPFVSRFPKQYTTALTVGQGLSGLLFGILGIIQDPGRPQPRFSVRIFFLCCLATYILAAIAFMYLLQAEAEIITVSESRDRLLPIQDKPTREESAKPCSYVPPLRVLLALQCWLALLGFGFIPSMLTLICAHYQNPTVVIMWATILGLVTDPLSRLLTALPAAREHTRFFLFTLTTTLFASFLLVTVLLGSHPPFSNHKSGAFFPVFLYTCFMFSFAFTNTMIYYGLRSSVQDDAIEYAYRMSGFITQCGSFIGAFLAFSLVISGKLT